MADAESGPMFRGWPRVNPEPPPRPLARVSSQELQSWLPWARRTAAARGDRGGAELRKLIGFAEERLRERGDPIPQEEPNG